MLCWEKGSWQSQWQVQMTHDMFENCALSARFFFPFLESGKCRTHTCHTTQWPTLASRVWFIQHVSSMFIRASRVDYDYQIGFFPSQLDMRWPQRSKAIRSRGVKSILVTPSNGQCVCWLSIQSSHFPFIVLSDIPSPSTRFLFAISWIVNGLQCSHCSRDVSCDGNIIASGTLLGGTSHPHSA